MAAEQPQQQQQQLWAFELCAIGGVPIAAHYTLFLLLFIQVFAATLSYQDNTYNALMFLLYGPVLFLTVLIHELGHAFATRSLGGIVDRIVLWPLGGFTVFGASHGAVIDDLWVAIAGPVTHILQGGFWIGIYAAVNHGDFSEFSTAGDFSEYSTAIILAELQDGGEFVSVLAAQTVVINVVLFIFNLAVPAYPLDGGRAFAALLVMGGFELATAARITSVTGIFNGLIMLFIGVYFYVIQNSAGALFLVLVAGFIIDSGLQLLKAVSVSRVYDHPLFQLDCYHNQGNVLRSLTASTTPPRIPLTNVV